MGKRVVLITGGSSGIGKAIGNYLKNKGFVVYGTTRDPNRHPGFSEFELLQLDVREQDTIDTALNTLLDREGRLDILINNAGIGITGPVEEIPLAEIQKVFEINFLGPVAMMKAVLPLMRREQAGLIINITSIAGAMGLPFRGYYSASKGALELITESVRMETARSGVRICSLAPGDFATNIAAGRYHAPVQKDSPYKNQYEHSLKLMNAHVDQGQDPIRVAEKVYGIIRKSNPAVHYTVGNLMQRSSLFLKRILPDKLFEKLLLKHYKL